MDLSSYWPLLAPSLALGVPVAFALAALLVPRTSPLPHAVRAAGAAAGLSLLGALAHVLITLGPLAALRPPVGALGVRLDTVTVVMLLLVTGIALVIAHYSRNYLDGDPDRGRYARWLLVTLASVSALIVTNDLLVLAIAWLATSAALHQLLTFYGDRVAAQIAAHKKFLISRLADVCLFAAVGLVGSAVGSVRLDAIEAFVAQEQAVPYELRGAAWLFAIAAILKSAQLPFHGWLMQVMEAPTPVSALLHAGVVNIGGFLMIRLAPLMAAVDGAQLALVCIGMATTVVAMLVMTTRVSIKVALAWSTSAQMGFMLVQCGLGAWHLALLHLVAHSLYKAHAFLSSSSVVDIWRTQSLIAKPRRSLGRTAVGLVVSGACVAAVCVVLAALPGHRVSEDPSLLALGIVLALSLAPLAASALGHGATGVARAALGCTGIAALYFGVHELAQSAFHAKAPAGAPMGWAIVVSGFTALFALQTWLEARPQGWLARRLHAPLFAGLYMDELFTRMTFLIWPPRLPQPAPRPEPASFTVASEV